jgi:predicted O-linked N-acetylglucosamine transferase (SPINDLY family)
MLLAKFEIQGIDPGRIGLCGFTATKQEHLELYGSCHIALDTYPYHGTTTTCEALWMGVPVISLAGKSHRSRVGASILTSVGCPELIATTPEEYVSYVVKLASNSKRLTHYRQSLRPQMQSSKLMNGESFVHDLECAYEAMLFTNL